MKSLFIIPLGICLAVSSCKAAPQPAAKVLLAQADTSKIAQVKAGTLKTANASWWGFSADDATDCLQSAINSGVPKLIVDNTGSDWIINKPLQLVSNQEIDFADGVVIQAKKGEFKGTNDCLFEGKNLTHISLIGQGNATLLMHREDYANPALYKKAEWRHGIGLWDCSDVVLRGLTVTKSGGDGLYLGAGSKGLCKNVLVENMNFDANYRQGISVISAENLTIRNCKLNNTDGTNPKAGIDFEPNNHGQRLVNCVLEDCELKGNAGGGVDIYAVNLDGTSPPISISVNRCSISGNSVGLAATATRSTTNPVKGTVTFTDCKFDHNQITIRDSLANTVQYLFKNCTLDFSGNKDSADWKNVPIVLTTDDRVENPSIGGVTFENTVVISDSSQPPIGLRFQGQATLTDQIKGSILVQSNGKTTPFDLAGFIQQKKARLDQINSMKLATVDLAKLHAPATDESASAQQEDKNTFYTRNVFTFLQYAKKGEAITINVTARKVYAQETEVDLIDPNGKKLKTYTIPYDNKPFPITFTAEETGIYRVVRTQNFSQRINVISNNPGNGLLVDKSLQFLPISGRLYFQVPAGVKNFTIGVATDSTADVALLNPSGKEVERHDKLGSTQLFTGSRADASKSEIWSIDVSNAVWAVIVNIYEPLVPIVSTNPNTLLLVD
jgi:hypothetical protein